MLAKFLVDVDSRVFCRVHRDVSFDMTLAIRILLGRCGNEGNLQLRRSGVRP